MTQEHEELVKNQNLNTDNEEIQANNESQESVLTEEGDEIAAANESDKMSVELAELKAKYAELNNSHLRLMAEFDNYRKRTLKEKADLIKNGGESTILRILPVVDDFERAMNATKNTTDINAVKEGVELIYNKFGEFLKQNNVTAIETENSEFNTEFHEAITTIPAPAPELKGKIVDCIQKGYMLNEKVIRFAKVVVGE